MKRLPGPLSVLLHLERGGDRSPMGTLVVTEQVMMLPRFPLFCLVLIYLVNGLFFLPEHKPQEQ